MSAIHGLAGAVASAVALWWDVGVAVVVLGALLASALVAW